ncbi:MAG: hypothetical protein ABS59_09035 [Methylobacterium sp. SCN 67-24]|jgi:predicted nucleic acid-binding protein|nr:MAG: hypothetical protein ABS59_09035 [Methylobacterium sp. SCN 67-24]
MGGQVTPAPPFLAYLDANAIIQFIEVDGTPFASLMRHVEAGALYLFTSELTLAEVLVKPLRDELVALIELYERLLTGSEKLAVLPVTRAVLRSSAEVRANAGNKGPDAIHIATALSASCNLFISSDARLRLPSSMTRLDIDAAAVWSPHT